MAAPGGTAAGAPGAAAAKGAPGVAQEDGATWGVQLAPPVSFLSPIGSFFFTPRSPIRLARDESRSSEMVLFRGEVTDGGAAGVPTLPAVLPAVLPPVLCGVTVGISKSLDASKPPDGTVVVVAGSAAVVACTSGAAKGTGGVGEGREPRASKPDSSRSF